MLINFPNVRQHKKKLGTHFPATYHGLTPRGFMLSPATRVHRTTLTVSTPNAELCQDSRSPTVTNIKTWGAGQRAGTPGFVHNGDPLPVWEQHPTPGYPLLTATDSSITAYLAIRSRWSLLPGL